MNQLLSVRRFGLLLKLYIAHNGKSLLLSAGLIIGLMLLLMAPLAATTRFSQIAELFHVLALFLCVMLGGNLFASTAFSEYSNSGSGISAIMIPASRLEKFLVILLVSLSLVTLFIVLFWQFHHWFIELANQNLTGDGRKYFAIPSDPMIYLTYCYFLLFGVVFLGSVYFPKNSFIKSAAVFVVMAMITFLLHYWLANHFTSYPSFLLTVPFSGWKINANREYWVDFPDPVGNMVWGFLVTLIVGLFCIAYVRLKEKEI